MKMFSGMMAGVISTIMVDFMLMKVKDKLNITSIGEKENDLFSRFRDIITNGIFANYVLIHLGFIGWYFYSRSADIPSPVRFYGPFLLLLLFWNIVGFWMNLYSRQSKMFQIRFLNNKLREFTQGNVDLTRRLIIINFDEIGDIAVRFNELMNGLNHDFKTLKQLTVGFSDNAGRIANATHDLAASTEEQAASSEEISVTMDNFSNQIERIKSDTEQQYGMTSKNMEITKNLSESLNDIISRSGELKKKTAYTLDFANQGMGEIKNSMENSVDMSNDIHAIVETIKSAGAKTEQIDTILNQIEEIVEQTSMLSMNAAIEAAHAGDAGSGFAIVAQEIRQLANNSALSVQNIGQIINEIKNSVEQAVEQAEKGEIHVSSTRQMVTSSEQNLQRIIDEIRSTSDMIFDIADYTQKQNDLIDELVKNSGDITRFSEEIMNFLREEASGAQQIDYTIVSMAQNQESNVESTVSLSDLAEKLHLMANQLSEVVNQFQTD